MYVLILRQSKFKFPGWFIHHVLVVRATTGPSCVFVCGEKRAAEQYCY